MIRKLSEHFGWADRCAGGRRFRRQFGRDGGLEHVGQVFENLAHVAQRLYDVVLITHSFGTVIPSFNAYRVLSSRDFGQFDPAGELHEAEFNLDFIKTALGIGYVEADRKEYFFGGISPAAQAGRGDGRLRIGLHAGSKGGIWAAKRWPGFARVGRRADFGGAEVVSVGIASEYVEGTLDKTILTIARMAEELSTRDAVVSNDSGIMNIANALGIPLVALVGPTNPATRCRSNRRSGCWPPPPSVRRAIRS